MQQEDIDRVQEFRKCIECFLCQDVCHVLRDHQCMRNSSDHVSSSTSPHWRCIRSIRKIALKNAKHAGNRLLQHHEMLHESLPREHQITDNGIIPLKERVVDDFYDPLGWFWRWLKKKADRKNVEALKR